MAERIQHKRSSFLGKRPNNQYLQPGEIAINTNAGDPGAFFEANDGSIVKVGPTFIGLEPPATGGVDYWNGEQWYDSGNGTLNLFSKIRDEWFPTLSPVFGGAPTAIFVGTEFPEATDDLSNDGSARPFQTINRATIEVARRSILRNRPDEPLNSRFVIVLLPGRNIVQNEPGLTTEAFITSVTKFINDQEITSTDLAQFNPTSGGTILPRGTSIIGLDLRKTEIRPTYYPFWSRSTFENNVEDIGERTSILKWTGNSLINSVTFRDKVSDVSISNIGINEENNAALCTSLRPHGFITGGESAVLTYPENVSQINAGEQTLEPNVAYFIEPISATQFYLRKGEIDGVYVTRNELPESPGGGTAPSEFFNLTRKLTTEHRLSAVSYATEVELNDFYTKVQHAFGNLDFANIVTEAEVNDGEVEIVSETPVAPTIETNSTDNTSPYLLNVSLRSNYGMCGLNVDGADVEGFRSALSCNFTTVSLQNDPDVFEVYLSTGDEVDWRSLRDATAISLDIAPGAVTDDQALTYLVNNVDLQYLRYYYRFKDDATLGGETRSSGLPNDVSDTRHYHTKSSNNAFIQTVSAFSIGPAINYWAFNGGNITVSNSNSNFGGQSIRSEGFSGLGTTGGSIAPNRGFTIQGVRCPRNVTSNELLNERNHLQLFLNVGVLALDPVNHKITLTGQVDTSVLNPYTLKAGTALWVLDLTTSLRYSAILANAPGSDTPLADDNTTIQLEAENDNITNRGVNQISNPYIRRFLDPRDDAEKSYYLWVQNTKQNHRPPQSSYILRYGDEPQAGTESLILPGRQLDPGPNGGWNQTFSIAAAMTKEDGDNPNVIPKQVIPSRRSATGYYLGLRLCDSFGPWVGDYVAPENDGTEPITANQRYAKGAFATSTSYNLYATAAEIKEGADAPDPITRYPSVWRSSKPYEVGQPVDEAFIPSEQYPAVADPWTSTYEEDDKPIYMRGMGVERESYFSNVIVDEDDGSRNLGINGTGLYANFADPALIDPSYTHTKLAMSRFLRLLGYAQDEIDVLLQPRVQSQRNIEVGREPWPTFIPGQGNAVAQGNWSVEFNNPSSIICTNHTWEWAGYFNYTKGLPEYQTSPLSTRLRFDYVISEVWGGSAIASGATESGEFVLSGYDIVGGDGQSTIDERPPTIGNEGDFVLRAGDNMTGDLTLGPV